MASSLVIPADLRDEGDVAVEHTRAASSRCVEEELGASCLTEIFETSVRRFGDRTAIQFGSQVLSYAELEAESNRLARCLRERGVSRGSLVALLLERSPDAYAAILAVLKCGAAYVPLDPGYPAERVRDIVEDSGALALVSHSDLVDPELHCVCDVLRVDELSEERAGHDASPLPAEDVRPEPGDLAYVIYTSGSTGRPKGVAIEHGSVTTFIAGARQIYGVTHGDRVYQGFSLAFDASVEELWMAFATGATLVVPVSDALRSGAGLAEFLAEQSVSFFSTVPTLLSMLDDELPTVRILILGGEKCSQELVKRWARPERRMFNTYGPTEASVVTTWSECSGDRPVTIGRPLPGYRVYVVDAEGLQLGEGEAGELWISGPGLARGYLNRPELSAERFQENPFEPEHPGAERIYRTGDLGCWTCDGEIQFLGRIDGQVKLRGFRVELSEIESVLVEHAAVRSAAVSVHEDEPGRQHLVAYVVAHAKQIVDRRALRAHLSERLPSYMVPTLFEALDELPTLPSGKVDRRQLPAPRETNRTEPGGPAPRSALERRLARVWGEIFHCGAVSTGVDFFMDLGGHSLLAAKMVSELRRDPAMASVALADVYENPTIGGLAAALEARAPASAYVADTLAERGAEAEPAGGERSAREARALRWRHFACSIAQAASLYLLALIPVAMLSAGRAVMVVLPATPSFFEHQEILLLVSTLPIIFPFMLGLNVGAKWLLIGRYREGRYPLWGSYFFRWWLVRLIQTVTPMGLIAGSPLMNVYARLMGARIGRNCWLGSEGFQVWDLVSIGDDSSIGVGSELRGYVVEDGYLHIGRTEIGRRCYVGTHCVLSPDTRLEDDARLEDLSMLPSGASLPEGETWRGSPARRDRSVEGTLFDAPPDRPPAPNSVNLSLYFLGSFFVTIALWLAALPGFSFVYWMIRSFDGPWYLLGAPLAGISFLLVIGLEAIVLKKLLIGRVKPGRYALRSNFYLRKWTVDGLLQSCMVLMHTLYATLYLNPWLRGLGAKIGRRAEISTADQVSPDLLEIDDESFVADAAVVGSGPCYRGWLELGLTSVGRRSFIGNSAFLPSGANVSDGCLIGCLSTPPRATEMEDGTSWLGTPSFRLPRRQQDVHFPERNTYRPPKRLYAVRLFIEFFRVTMPAMVGAVASAFLIANLDFFLRYGNDPLFLLGLPLLFFGMGLASCLFVALAKWILMGIYKPGAHPLWSSFVWRTELVTGLYESIAVPGLAWSLAGTCFLPWYLRLLGTKVGRRAYIDSIFFSEFDLAKLGDDVVLNTGSTIQTHLFEDRIMKLDRIEIRDRCSVGNNAVVLYDTVMEPGSSLGNLSLLMKGERLPAGSAWHGNPSQPV